MKFVLFFLFMSLGCWANGPSLKIPLINEAPVLSDFEGMTPKAGMAEKMLLIESFVQREPVDGEAATQKTQVWLAYDQRHFYAVFLAFDAEPQKVRARMGPRGSINDDDQVSILLDTFNDSRRAYHFAVSPLGIQDDALWSEGGDMDDSYQTLWYSNAKRNDQGYVALLRIPFKSLRFPKKEQQEWGIMLRRSIPRLSEESFWPQYSGRIDGRLNQAGTLTGLHGISPGRNIQIVPFFFARNFSVLDESLPDGPGFRNDDFDPDLGVDAKMVIKDSFVLDVTVNPDFSQVESDEPQVTVNQRFEVFFPEKRTFFLENADFFSTFTNLVFTRRIQEPRGGLRFTGKRGKYAVGVMAVDDEAPGRRRAEDDPLNGKVAQVKVVKVSRDIFKQSRLGVLFTDRSFGDDGNQVLALDGRMKINPNWSAQFTAAGSRDDAGANNREGTALNVMFNRNSRHYNSHNHYLRTSDDFVARLGFLGAEQRPGTQNIHHVSQYIFRPERRLISWGPRFRIGSVFDMNGERLDRFVNPHLSFNWVGDTELSISYNYNSQIFKPEELPQLIAEKEMLDRNWEIELESEGFFSNFAFEIELSSGVTPNLRPAEGQEPKEVDTFGGNLELAWWPIAPLRIELEYFYTELEEEQGRVFRNQIARTNFNWQFTREFSLRGIVQYEDTDVNPLLTSIEQEQGLNTDVLFRYQLNPWTSFYLGYNNNRSNFDLVDGAMERVLIRTPSGLKTDGRQFFIKGSILFKL